VRSRPLPPADDLGRLAEPLTSIDRRVLEALPADGRSRRLAAIVAIANQGLDQWSAQRTTEAEALGILRGLARCSRPSRCPTGELHPDPRNPRRITPRRMALLERQVADDDFMRARPVIALPDGTIVAGEQRWRARARIGRETCFALFADLDASSQRVEWAAGTTTTPASGSATRSGSCSATSAAPTGSR
jgi:hypothetical protein